MYKLTRENVQLSKLISPLVIIMLDFMGCGKSYVLSMYLCGAKEQTGIRDTLYFQVIRWGLDPEHETVHAQIVSQDPFPPLGTMLALLQTSE